MVSVVDAMVSVVDAMVSVVDAMVSVSTDHMQLSFTSGSSFVSEHFLQFD
jgi:hypothetical protein